MTDKENPKIALSKRNHDEAKKLNMETFAYMKKKMDEAYIKERRDTLLKRRQSK